MSEDMEECQLKYMCVRKRVCLRTNSKYNMKIKKQIKYL